MPLVTPSTVNIVIDAQNKASAKLGEISKDLANLEKEVDGFIAKNNDMREGNNDAGVSFDDLRGMAVAYGAALGVVTAGVGAFVKAFDMGEIAAQNERLITAGHEMASQFGGDMDLIIKKIQEASHFSVSEMDIIASANKAMMLGLGADADQLANLMEIAAFRGRAMGLSTTQAFDDIVRGIGRASPLILDNLGIVIDAEATYQAYADAIGVSKDELTKAQKTQALLNRVLEEGNGMLEKAGGLALDNATHYERWNAELENTKKLLLDNALGMSRFASMGADFLSTFQTLMSDDISNWLQPFELFSEFAEKRIAAGRLELQALRLEGTAWAENQKNNLVIVRQSAEVQAEYTESLVMSDEQIKAMTASYKAQLDLIGSLTNEIQKYADKETGLQAKHDELIAKKQQLIAQGWLPESEKITEINAKLAENELAMQQNAEQAELAGRRRILSMLEQQLALDGLSAAETSYLLDLGLKWGVYSQQAVDAAKAAQAEVMNLTNQFNALPTERTIHINLEISRSLTQTLFSQAEEDAIRNEIGFAQGTGGWRTVPPGHPNDSYPILLSSGERFAVVPRGGSPAGFAGGTGGVMGGVTVNLSYAPVMSLGDENELRSRLVPLIINGVKEARAQGVIQ